MGAVILVWVEVAFICHVEIVALIKKLVHLGLQSLNLLFLLLLIW
jgi:hypothetical protein